MARLTITAHARADLQEIHSHIAKDKPQATRRFVERLRTKARQIAEAPGMGRSRSKDLRQTCSRSPLVNTSSSTANSQEALYSCALFTAAATYQRSFNAIES